MADYLIHDSTLEDIADAIRSKTGGSSLIAPEDMPTEIASISGGGSSGGVLLYDQTTTEAVSAIQIDFTSAMQGYDLYYIALSGTFNKQPYPYIGVNTATNNRYMNQLMSSNSWAGFISKIGSNYTFIVGAGVGSNTVESINYVHMRAYAADGVFNTGFNVKIWGYMNQ